MEAGRGSVLNRLTMSFPDGTRLDLEVMIISVMRKINEDFIRLATGAATA